MSKKGAVIILTVFIILSAFAYFLISGQKAVVIINGETYTGEKTHINYEYVEGSAVTIKNGRYATVIETLTVTLPGEKSIQPQKIDLLVLYPGRPDVVLFNYYVSISSGTVVSFMKSMNLNWHSAPGGPVKTGLFENVNEDGKLIAEGKMIYSNYFMFPPVETVVSGVSFSLLQKKFLDYGFAWGVNQTLSFGDGMYALLQPYVSEFDEFALSPSVLTYSGVAVFVVESPFVIPDGTSYLVLPAGTYYGYFDVVASAEWTGMETYTVVRTIVKDLPS